MTKPKILILGKLPPPFIGPAIATNIILTSSLRDSFTLLHLDTTVNKTITGFGTWSAGKLSKSFALYLQMLSICIGKRPSLVLVPISQSTTGIVKDACYILLAHLSGRKVIIHLRGSNFKNVVKNAPSLAQRLVKFTLRRAAGAIVLGDNLRHLFEDYYPPHHIYVVPNGGDFQLPPKTPSSQLRVLNFANFLESKGVYDVLQALDLMKQKNVPGYTVDAVGAWFNHDFQQKCLNFVKEKNIDINFHAPESGERKWQHYADADVFVFTPNEPEGHPWVIIEAMAAGLPVISTDQGAITESVIDGVNGFIVPANDPAAIAEKLLLLLNDGQRREKMGRASRERYEKYFTVSSMVKNLTRVFNTLTQHEKTLDGVEHFWEDNLCGHHFVSDDYMSNEFFRHYREFRYKKTHHLNTYIKWDQASGKDVLEVGLGIGSDGSRWAKHARSYSGIDLTNEAVVATKKHLELLGLSGNVQQGNAEALPYESESFDLVYSHGVIHHTTSIENALNEINRVLKTKGETILMLYSKDSFNYWIRIQFYFRVRFLLAWGLSLVGIKSKDPWKNHLKNRKEMGWSYFSWSEWPHHCTDGPDCEIANIYTRGEIQKMMDKAGFTITQLKKAHFPIGASPAVEQALGKRLGFHQLIWAQKK